MIKYLSSVKFTFYNLVLMILLMGTGVGLSQYFKSSFKMMNEINIMEWIEHSWSNKSMIVIWFALLCLSAGLLFLNALFCTFTKQIQTAIKSRAFQKWLFMVLHCLFIIVLACHGLSLIIGSKQSNAQLFPDDHIMFNNEFMVKVSQVVFQDDINILKADYQTQRGLMTRDNVNRKHNYVDISLIRHKELLETKKVKILSPLRYGPVQVTLSDFVLKDGKLGVNLNITKNYLNYFFFAIYALMILTFGLYVFLSYRDIK